MSGLWLVVWYLRSFSVQTTFLAVRIGFRNGWAPRYGPEGVTMDLANPFLGIHPRELADDIASGEKLRQGT